MQIELNVTLKGSTVWRKGLILDDETVPLPGSLLKELDLKTGTVRIIKKKQAKKPDDLLFRKFDKKQPPKKEEEVAEKQPGLLSGGLIKPLEQVINIEDIAPDENKEAIESSKSAINGKNIAPDEKKKVTRTDIFRMNKAALVDFIGDEEKTGDKTNRELKEIAYGMI